MRLSLLSTALLALAFLAAPASAQTTFGIKAGLNVSNFVGDNANGSEARLGFVGGVTARVPFTPALSLQAEALYSQKGEEFVNEANLVETTRLDYIEIPVSLRYALPVDPALDLGISAGGYVGVPLSGEVDLDGRFDSELDLNTDYGVLAGLDIGSGPFSVDARYTYGLTDAIQFDPVLGGNLDKKNSVVSLTFGYRFGGPTYRGGRY